MADELIPDFSRPVLAAVRDAGGQPFIVGGFVRDMAMRRLGYDIAASKDVDIEAHEIAPEALSHALEAAGRVDAVGVSFGVLKVTVASGETIDVSIPRRESKVSAGLRGSMVEPEPSMTIQAAARRRDFTVNSMALTPEGDFIDPFGGLEDIRRGLAAYQQRI